MPPLQETPVQKATRNMINQLQVTLFEFERHPPLDRSDIVRRAKDKLRNLEDLVGHQDGTHAFRLHLLDLAAYLTYAASLVDEGKIGHR